MSSWLKKTLDSGDQPERVIAKEDRNQLESNFLQDQNVKILWQDPTITYRIRSTALFCIATSRILARRSRSKEWREIGRRFATLWWIFADKLQEIFPDEDTEGTYVVPTIDFRAQVLNVYDRRNGIGKPVFKFAPIGAEHWYCISPCVSVPGMPVDILQQIVIEASAAAKDRPTDV